MRRLINLIALLLLLTNCNQKNDTISFGTAEGLRHGESWASSKVLTPGYDTYFNLNLYVLDGDDVVRQKMNMFSIPLQEGTFVIFDVDNREADGTFQYDSVGVDYYTLIADGDVPGQIYDKVDESFNNWISIDSYDSETNKVQGEFNVQFIKSEEGQQDGLPELLHFENVRFTATIQSAEE